MDRLAIDETANCACGAIHLSAKGRVLSMLVCSCLDCRKATGTGHSGFVLMNAEAVTITGLTSLFDKTAASGATISRHFCPNCGTPIKGETSRSPALTLIPVGLFSDPHWFAPTQAIFSRTHLDWDTLPVGVPQYETYRPRTDA